MRKQLSANALALRSLRRSRGFTLVETLAAITLITVAIVAPMELTIQSLESAYYSRDQITASNLAQEGIEAVRSLRDANILATARGTATPLFHGIPTTAPFTIDAHTIPATLSSCGTTCSASQATLQTNGALYGYASGWTTSIFQRTATASIVWSDSTGAQELRITVVVSWKTGAYKSQSTTISEDLYNWIATGVGA